MNRRIVALVLAGAAASCGAPEPREERPSTALSFEPRTLSVRGGDCPDAETRCATVDASWIEAVAGPEAGRAAVNDYVLERLRSGLRGVIPEEAAAANAGVEELAGAFVKAFESFLVEFPDHDAAWFHRFKAEALVASSDVVTILTVDQSYTGGAHAIERAAYASFRPAGGRRIGLDDLVTDRSALTAAGERRFREAHRLSDTAAPGEGGFEFEGGAFSLPENFGVFPEGIRFRWDAYEIAAFTDGPTEITVAWDDLGAALRSDAPRP